MRTVTVKIVDTDIEFELEVQDHWPDKDIWQLAQQYARHHVPEDFPKVTIES